MKKLLYIFLGLSLIFGCSDDSSNESVNPQNNIDPVLCFERYNIFAESVYLTSYTYSGTKIISEEKTIIDGVNTGNYLRVKNHIYSGDLRISTSYFWYDQIGDAVPTSESTYNYEYNSDDLLFKETYVFGDNNTETFYSWTNENLTRQVFDSDGILQSVTNYDSGFHPVETIYYSNGQINSQAVSTYDSSYGPFCNVTGFLNPTYCNNRLTSVSTATDGGTTTYQYEYSFNDDGYPVSGSYTRTCSLNDCSTYRDITWTYY